jgi:hypothetical protein
LSALQWQDWTHVNIPSPLSPSFIALEKNTGELLGEDDAESASNLARPMDLTVAGTVNGKTHVYFGGGDGVLYALNTTPVKEGDVDLIKKVWWFDAVPPEYKIDKNGKPINTQLPRARVRSTPRQSFTRTVSMSRSGRIRSMVKEWASRLRRCNEDWRYHEDWPHLGLQRCASEHFDRSRIDPTEWAALSRDFLRLCALSRCGDWQAPLGARYASSTMWGSTFVVDGKSM